MKSLFLIPTAALLLLSQGVSAQFSEDARYKLTPHFQPTKSLDVINDSKKNTAWIDNTQDLTGQSWQLAPIKDMPGYFRLTSDYQPGKSLDVVNDGQNNTVWLDKTQKVTGQYWKATPVEGMQGYFRLSPAFQPTKSLDVINDGQNNKIALAETTTATGQYWKIERIGSSAVRFKNRYTADQWINIEKGTATADAVKAGFLSAQWNLIPVDGTKYYRLQNVWKPELYLNIENGVVEATAIWSDAWSSHWELEEVVDEESGVVYHRLKNRWKADSDQPAEYLHTEKGKLECTSVPLSFQSANWMIER